MIVNSTQNLERRKSGCGSIAGNARKKIEQETGKPVITSKNSIDLGRLIGVVDKEIENEEEKMIVTNLSFKEKNMKNSYQINVRDGCLNKYSRILNKEVRIYKEWVYKHYSEMTEDTDNGEFQVPLLIE